MVFITTEAENNFNKLPEAAQCELALMYGYKPDTHKIRVVEDPVMNGVYVINMNPNLNCDDQLDVLLWDGESMDDCMSPVWPPRSTQY